MTVWPLIRFLGLVAVVAAPAYVGACAWFPFARCRKCAGSGRKATSSGKAWRNCRRCKGTARRLRLGRKIYNRLRQLGKEAA